MSRTHDLLVANEASPNLANVPPGATKVSLKCSYKKQRSALWQTTYNLNKKIIKQVLNDQKCQLRLQAEGLSILNNLADN